MDRRIDVSVIPSAKDFTKNLRAQIGDLGGIGKSIGDQAGSGLESGLLSAAKKAAAGLAAIFAGKKLIDFGADTLSIGGDFQKTEVAFEGLIGDTELARESLEKLKAFSAETPFDFPQIADAAKKFLAFGRTADEIIPILQNVGDAAAILGASSYDINLVTRALGQIGSKGRVQLEELNQIAEAFPGVNPIKILADATEVSVAEFTTALSKPGGALTAFGLTGTEAVDALVKGFGELNGAAGAMDRQMRTLPGAISNLKDSFLFFRDALADPFLQPVADFINDAFVPAMKQVTPVLVALGQQFAGFVNPLIVAFGELLPKAVDKFAGFLERVGLDITPDASTFGTGLAAAAEDALAVERTYVDAFKEALSRFSASVVAVFQPIADSFRTLAEQVGPVVGPVGDALSHLGSVIVTYFDAAAEALKRFAVGAVGVVADGIPFLSSALQVVLPLLASLINAVADGLARALAAGTGALRAFVAAFRDGGDEITSSGFAGAAERVGLVLRHAFDAARDALAVFVAAYRKGGDAIASTGRFSAAEKAGLALRRVLDSARWSVDRFAASYNGVGTTITATGVGAVAQFAGIKLRVLRKILDGITDAVDKFAAAYQSVGTDVTATGVGAVAEFAGVKLRSLVGFLDGATGVIGKFVAAYKSVGTNVTSTGIVGVAERAGIAVRDLIRGLSGLAGAFRAGFAGNNDIAGGWLSVFEDVGRKVGDLKRWFTVDVPASFDTLRQQFADAGAGIDGSGVVDKIGGLGDKLRNLFDLIRENPDALKNVALAAGVTAVGGAGVVAGAVAAAPDGTASKAVKAVTPVLSGLAGAAAAVPGPLAIAALAIAGIGAAAVIAYKNIPAFQEAVDRVKAAFDEGGFGGAMDQVAVEFDGFVPKILPALDRAKDAISGWVTGTAIPFLKTKGPEWANALWAWLEETAGPWIKTKGQVVLNKLKKWVDTEVFPFLNAHAEEWGKKLTDFLLLLVEKALIGLVAILPRVWNLMAETLTKIETVLVLFLVGVWHSILEHVLKWKNAFIGWILETVTELPGRLDEIGAAISTFIPSFVPRITEAVISWGGAMLGWVADAVLAAPGKLEEIATAILGFIGGLPQRIADAAVDIWRGLYYGFVPVLNQIIDAWNRIQFKLPDFEGIKVKDVTLLPGWGKGPTLEMPQIERLLLDAAKSPSPFPGFASGGVVTSPTLAWLGEVRSAQPEIVSPEWLMRQVVNDAIAEVGMGGGGPLVGTVNVTEPVRPAEFVDEMNARLGWMLTPRNER